MWLKKLFNNKVPFNHHDEVKRAQVCYESGNKQEALAIYKDILKKDPSCKPARFEIGKLSEELSADEHKIITEIDKQRNNKF